MKTTRKLMLVLSMVLLAAPLTLAAMSSERAYIESYRGRTDIPVPIKVVSPDVDSEYAGTTVELVFTVGPAGAPQNIEVRTPVDRELARVLTDAVQHWRFAPEQREGHPLAAKVMLPIRIVDQSTDDSRIAAR
jgi:Gram-negative bacterial TonB protein C-terminal